MIKSRKIAEAFRHLDDGASLYIAAFRVGIATQTLEQAILRHRGKHTLAGERDLVRSIYCPSRHDGVSPVWLGVLVARRRLSEAHVGVSAGIPAALQAVDELRCADHELIIVLHATKELIPKLYWRYL